jgi:ABC-type multidrug transport system ATPase subunit/ABC-type multidrug transport system permease subunit
MTEQLHRELNTTPHLSPEALKTQASISRDIDHYENYNVDDLFEEDFRPPPRPVTAEAVEHPYCLVWKNLSLTLNKCGSLLVDNVSGAVCAGRVLALMGPSGAGKTTLLNALGNRAPYGTVTGEITFGRRDFGPGDLYYVPQFDEVNGTLTVYEQIELVGLLKCSDREDMTRRLGIILLALGLRHKVKMLCRDLSNGELKKVSVGMGMICNPKVLFLDEPTTGLDSTAAYSIVKHLTDLSKRLNIAVIMTIHQPAEMVFDMLQDLYILEAGRLAYSGPLSCSEKYFKALGYLCPGKTAVADFFMDAVNKPPTILLQSSWQTLYLSSKFSKNVTQEQMSLDVASPTAPAATPPPSNFAQLRTLVFFFLRYYYREFGFHYARLLCVIVIAFYSGTLFLRLKPEVQNVIMYSGAIFFNTWSVLFSTLAATNLMTRDRRQAVEQIKNAVISPGMYCTAQLIASLPFNFVTALVFQSVFHWLTNISTHKSSFFYAIMTAFGHLLLMEGFMLVIVEVLKNALLCITVAMLVMGWLFLFAGFFVKVPDMPFWLRWVCYLTPTKYSFDGYLYMVFHTQMFQIQGTPISRTGDFLLSSVYMQTGVKPWNMFGVLLGWIALIRFIHFATMKYQVRHFQPKRIKMSGYLEEYEYE